MPKANVLRSTFTGGRASPNAYGRVDLEKMQSTSEIITNVATKVLGGFSIRPGFEYLRHYSGTDKRVMDVFSASRSDSAIILFQDQQFEVEIDGEVIERPKVKCTVPDGEFPDLSSWTVTASTGSQATIAGGGLRMVATARGAEVTVKQEVTTESSDIEHALRVIVSQGTVMFAVGTKSGSDNLVRSTRLGVGTHSLAFTPGGTSFWIEFSTDRDTYSIIKSCVIEDEGKLTLPAPWTNNDLQHIRSAQSIDVMFVACRGVWQQKIERRAERSWSIARYFADDGPFTIGRTAPVKLKPSVLTGNGTLQSSGRFFTADHVGALFRLFHSGQRVETDIAGDDEYSDTLRITGVEWQRVFEEEVTGTYSGTVKSLRSTDGEDTGFVYNDGQTNEFDDANNNQIAWRRMGFQPGDYTSGMAHISMSFDGGGGYGICRVTKYIDSKNVEIEILRRFQQTTYTRDWREGEWSPEQFLPSAVCFYDGRLAWGGDDKLWMSVSDAFGSFNIEKTGDSAPIQRSVATGGGGAYSTNNLLGLQRLVVLTDAGELSVRSSNFDEPLKPDSITIKECSSQGSARVNAVRIDRSGFYVQFNGKRVYRLQFAADQDFQSDDMCELIPEIGDPGIVKLAVQRQPDTRIYALRSNGTIAVLTYYFQGDSQVAAWLDWETDGKVKDIVVVPAPGRDEIHLLVEREKNGGTILCRERVADESMVARGNNNRCLDSFVWSVATPTRTVVDGLDHLNGRTVRVWADGVRVADYVPDDGKITLASGAKSVLVGLPYEWRVKSTKLAYAAGAGTALLQKKRVEHMALLLRETHVNGIKIGPDFDRMDGLRRVYKGETVDENRVFGEYDVDSQEFPGTWDTDARICLKGEAPYPASVLALVLSINTADKI